METPPMTPKFTARALTLSDFDEKTIQAWEDLERRALEPNAFLSPCFILPALKHLEGASNAFGLFVEKVSNGSTELVGVVFFNCFKFSRHFPLPHLKLFDTKYSFQCGYLTDRDCASEVMEAVFAFLVKPNGKWHALVIQEHIQGTSLATLEHRLAESFRMKWLQFREWERAVLRPTETVNELKDAVSKNTYKAINRRTRRLAETGVVKSNLLYGEAVTTNVIEKFLELENTGWKREHGTALLCNNKDAAFFREMLDQFNRSNRALFSQLELNDETIASSVKLASGNHIFSFKIGWNPQYAKFSPGILNELRWLKPNSELPYPADLVDSGAADTAMYMNEIWPQRRAMNSGVFAITPHGKLVLPLVALASKIKNRKRAAQNKKIETLEE